MRDGRQVLIPQTVYIFVHFSALFQILKQFQLFQELQMMTFLILILLYI